MRIFPIFLLFFPLLLNSCTGFPKEEVALTLVFDEPLQEGKYPSYFKEFTMPFELENCEKAILLKPIYYVRGDISRTEKEANAWYFKDVGENTVEFSTNFLNQFYTDSIVPKYLTQKSENKKLNLDSYLDNEEDIVIIFSEESSLKEYKGFPILNTARDVQLKIKETSCDNKDKKIAIIVNPKELLKEEPTPEEDEDEITLILDNPCKQNTVADGLDLKDDLLEIINTNKSYKERDNLAKQVWKKYFDEMASVKMYVKPNQKFPDFWESGDGSGYLINRLAFMNSIVDINILRIERHVETGKISGLVVIECHNASEVL